MSPDSIFAEAIEIESAPQRAAFLDEACGADDALRAEVERLVRDHFRAGGFLERPAAEWAAALDAPAGERPGTLVGPYKLLEEVGAGGMGAVWMAQQTEPVRRLVAIKLIKAGMDTRQVVARFEAERQALALMDHPNIAKVLDGGSADGRPYFVMELVKGVPITKYCDEHRLTPRQRLELFVPVCAAVQHAHQKGVIHRDLKPSNVLVAPYDGKPVPKVIDFGVAKATGQQLTEATLYTGLGAVVGTLEYMSPEQAELNNRDVDTRSDVYSLGVLLYELLTGGTPLIHQRVREAPYGEVIRRIKEEEPPRPSDRLGDSGEALASISANRHTEPAKLARLVRGELDWIVMKALEKERDRRYDSANGFAMDVQRYLNDEPVLACPPSARYRLGKFLRRYRGPVVAAVLVLLALFGGGIGAAFGLVEAREKGKVQSLWQQAERDRHAAELARGEAEVARDGERKAKRDAEDAREKLAAVEYGRTIQLAYQEWRDNNVAGTLALLASTRPDLRGWEWRYLHRLCHSHLITLKGHTSLVVSASFSADGTRAVTASYDKTARVWDARTGALLLTLTGHSGLVYSASFSADGYRVVTGSWDNTARVWDARSGKELLVLRGHALTVRSASFSPDGSRVVTASADRTARVWDARTGALLRTLRGHAGQVWSAAFSADGTRVVTAGQDATARVWDAKRGAVLRTLRGHANLVVSASFSADGSRVVTASADRTARVWDAGSGKEVLALRGHASQVWSASFSGDGTRVVTAGQDATARVWDARSGDDILTLRGHTDAVQSASFSADGSRVLTAGHDATARVWDARSGAEFFSLTGHSSFVQSASFSADGSRVLTAGQDRTARVWDARTGALLLTLTGHTDAVLRSASFSADGTRAVTASYDKTARVWDARTGALLLTLTGHSGEVYSAAFSADGSRVLTASADRTARVWDARTGAVLRTLTGHSGAVTSASFSADGTRAVTASYDKTARVWDARTGALLLTLRGHTNQVWSGSFSTDGSRVITAGHDLTARVWDARNGKEVLALRGHTSVVVSAAFSADGTRAVTASFDKTARVWDAKHGAELLTLKGHTLYVNSASFSADGTRVVTASSDGTARVWDARPVGGKPLPTGLALPRPAK